MPSSSSSRWRTQERRRRDDSSADDSSVDAGFTLTEIIITIVLLSIVTLAILQAVTTSIKSSSVSRAAAQVETTVVNAADRVNRAPKDCNYLRFAQAAVLTQGWPASTVSVAHEYYVPGANAATAGSWTTGTGNSPGCPGATPDDLLVQRVSITITSPDGRVHRTIQVVKSDV